MLPKYGWLCKLWDEQVGSSKYYLRALAPSDHDRVKIALVLNLLYLYGDSFLFEYLWGVNTDIYIYALSSDFLCPRENCHAIYGVYRTS